MGRAAPVGALVAQDRSETIAVHSLPSAAPESACPCGWLGSLQWSKSHGASLVEASLESLWRTAHLAILAAVRGGGKFLTMRWRCEGSVDGGEHAHWAALRFPPRDVRSIFIPDLAYRNPVPRNSVEKKPGAQAPGWALGVQCLRLGAGREGPCRLGVQRRLRGWGCGSRGLHRLLRGSGLLGRGWGLGGGSSFLCWCSFLGGYGLLGGSSFLRWCSFLGGYGLLGRSSFLRWCSFLGGYGLLGRSSFLRWCSFLGGYGLLGRSSFLRWCSFLGGYGLLGRSSFLRWCSFLGGYGLLGRSSFLRWCSFLGGYGLLGRSSFLRWCSFFCRCSLLGGRFFRSCHHVLLGSISKEHFLPALDRKRSMGMECNSIPMNTGTHRIAAPGGAGGGRGVKIHGSAKQQRFSPRKVHHRTGIR